jgi:hypothetical protein
MFCAPLPFFPFRDMPGLWQRGHFISMVISMTSEYFFAPHLSLPLYHTLEIDTNFSSRK